MTGFGSSYPNKSKKKNFSNKVSLLLESAVQAHKEGDIKEAEVLYLNAIKSGCRNEIAFSNLGVIYKNTNRLQEAIETYNCAISINPKFADAYSNLGNLFIDLGRFDDALAATLKSLELKPGNADALVNLGLIYYQNSEFDKAVSAAMKAITSDKRSVEAYLLASKLLCGQKLFADARQLLEKAKENIENNHILDGELVRVNFLQELSGDKA